MSLAGWLKRLEDRYGLASSCPECGLAPDERRPYVVLYPDPDKGFQGDPDERCGRCDRFLYVVLNVVYDSPAGEEGEGS